jgi:predicted ATPase
LRALLDWSYSLLSAVEQTSLRRLAVLVGEYTFDAAAAVIDAGPASALDILDALVAKSLVAVRASEDGSARYRLLETTRLHALEKLQTSGEADITAQRHARHFLILLDSRHGGQIDLEYTGRAHSLREHLGNVRAALEWCFSRQQPAFDATLAIELAAAATPVFFELSLLGEAYKWSAAALALLDDTTRGSRREMLLTSTWAISSMWTRGNSDDVLTAIARGLELARPLDEPTQRLRMLATRHVFLIRVADFRGALDAAQQWDVEAQRSGDITCLAIADLMQGVAHHFRGDQATAKRHMEAGFARAGARNLQLCGVDHRVRALITLARVHWLCGEPEQAMSTARLAIDAAMRSGKPLDTCFALLFTAPVYLWCGYWEAAQEIIDQLNRHTHWHLLKPFHPIASAMQGALLIGRGQTQDGTRVLLDILQTMHEERQNVVDSFLACWAADGLVAAGRAEEAVAIMRQARRKAVHAGEAVHLPELLRIQAEALHAMSPAHATHAVRMLTRSCRMAHHQSALSWELRSTISLARIQISCSQHEEAHQLLAEMFGRFRGGFTTRDLVTARELLDSLRDMSADSADNAIAFHHSHADAHATDSRVE